MKSLGPWLLAKTLAGLLVLVPLAILFVAAVEIYGMLEKMAAVSEMSLPFPPVINALLLIAVILVALGALCLLIGLLVSTGMGGRFARFVEQGIADKIPLLGLIRNLTLNVTGAGNSNLKSVEVDIHGTGACQYGFLIEVLPDGRNVVFLPGAPAVTLGQVFVVPVERVRELDVAVTGVVNAVSQWGTGASEIYR